MTQQFPAINPAFLTGSRCAWPLTELAALGYRGLEVTPACIETATDWLPRAAEAGIPPVSVNALPELRPYLTGSLSDDVFWRRRATLDRLLAVLDWMGRHEVPYLIVAPSRRGEIFQTEERARELLVESVRELAADGSATILIEGAPFRLFSTSSEIASLVDEIGLSNVAAALDVGHAMLNGESPVRAAGNLGGRLRYLQVRDFDVRPGLARLDQHLPLGAGSLTRDEMPPTVAELPLAVTITAPDRPLEAAGSAIDWLGRGAARTEG